MSFSQTLGGKRSFNGFSFSADVSRETFLKMECKKFQQIELLLFFRAAETCMTN
jgi:hypothetical protein